jgi:hypothetical protein
MEGLRAMQLVGETISIVLPVANSGTLAKITVLSGEHCLVVAVKVLAVTLAEI